jgi:hypothetical protein
MLEFVRQALRTAGVDRPVMYVLMGRIWSLLSGPVTIYLVVRSFSPAEQDYYYTFASVMALQVFFELGFSQCTTQFASHEFSRLSFRPDGTLKGEAEAHSRLASLARLSIRWYVVLGAAFLVGVGTGGYFFFHQKAPGGSWVAPWWLLCGATTLTLMLVPFWALLEGCNRVAFVYGYRTVAATIQSMGLWIALSLGAGLYACAVPVLCTALCAAAVLGWKWRHFFRELLTHRGQETVSWKQEMWPFQWRTGVSWVSGYFIYNFLTPLVYHFQPESGAAGRLGMTLQLFNALHAVAVSWTSSKMPRFGMLIAQRQFKELNHLFVRATARAMGAALVGGAVLLGAVWWLQHYYVRFGSRFLGLDCLGLLWLVTVVNQFAFALSFYARAHKVEPFAFISVVNGAATGLSALVLVKHYGAWGGCLAYVGVQVLLLPLGTYIWWKGVKQWQR